MTLGRIYRQVDRGVETEPTLVHDERDRFPHYVDRRFDGPLPPGWRVERKWISNWDGGPGLRRDVRVLDRAEPFSDAFGRAAEVMARAEALACELVERLRVWGAPTPRVFVWQLGGIDEVGNAPDPLQKRDVILRELAFLPTKVIPPEIDDPYGAFGPAGPPVVPRELVGRRLDELPDPEPLLRELRALGVRVDIAGDEIRLALAGEDSVVER
jgi:hypothetical protein